MVYPLAELTLGNLTKLFIKKIGGMENIIKDKPFIVVCNHASYIDDFIVPSIFLPIINKKMHFYVHSYYFNNPILRRFLEWGECIPVDPTKSKRHKKMNKRAFETALRYLKKGDVVGIFPEGTRSIDGKLQKARTGVARLTIAAKVPVLPVGIIGSNKILPKGKFLPRPKRCRVNIGKPIYFEEYYKRKINKKSLDNVTRKIMNEIAGLTGQKYRH